MKKSKKLTKNLFNKVKKKYNVKRLRRIQGCKNKMKSFLIIQSPYNSNECLIENHSTPFFEEEEVEKEDFDYFPNELNNFTIGEIKDFFPFNSISTSDSSYMNSELVKI